jgi:hypothetical protein
MNSYSALADPLLTHSYEVVPTDLRAFQEYHLHRTPAFRRQYYGGLVCVAILTPLVMVLLVGLSSQRWGLAAVVGLSGAIVGSTVYPWLHRRARRKFVEQAVAGQADGGLFGAMEMQLAPTGLTVANRVARSLVDWAGVRSIEESPTHLYLYVSGVSAMIIPKRSFASESEAQEFMATAQRLHQGAQGKVTGR